jgi:hypothetical protein
MRYEQHALLASTLELSRQPAVVYAVLASICLFAAYALVKRVLQPIGMLLRQATGVAFAALFLVAAVFMFGAAVLAGR